MNAVTASAHAHSGYHREWAKHTVHVHGFANLSSERGEYVDSPEFMRLGNQWRLELYPGGDDEAAEGMVSLYLNNESDKAIDIDFGFSVNDSDGKQTDYGRTRTPYYFSPVGADADDDDTSSWGWTNFAPRSTLLSALVDGTLVIEVRMRLAKPTKSAPPPFIPENPSACKTIEGVFLDENYSDIIFEVGMDHRKDNATKIAKIALERFPAHRLIVANCSSIFADLCESTVDSTTPIQINDVTHDVFRLLLSYMYGIKLSDDDMKSHAKEIIDASEKYGVFHLKLEAEASLVEGTTFTIENVMELLLYAESKNLALLKEAAMDYIVENKTEVIEKLSFANAPGTLVTDVLAAMSRGERVVAGGSDVVFGDSQYNALRISELRKRVHEKGLNVDGSREMLIAALKGA
jgi:hypothetical protein